MEHEDGRSRGHPARVDTRTRRGPSRRRPPHLHDAQRRHRLGGGDHRLHAERQGADRRGLGASPRRAEERLARPRRHEADQGTGDDALEEFYKVGPGPSSSHTIGPMRITYDFYQRCTKLPADQLAKATALKVHLFGSLSATGKGHGTERAALAGIIGKEPATVDPLFLDELSRQAGPDLPGQARRQDLQRLAEGHHLRRAQGRLPAPEHHDLQADGGRHGAPRAGVLLGRRRVHRVEGLPAAEEGPAEVPVRDDEGAAGSTPRRTSSRSRRS